MSFFDQFKSFVTYKSPTESITAARAYGDMVWEVKNEAKIYNNLSGGKGYLFEFLEHAKLNSERGANGLHYKNFVTGLSKARGGPGNVQAPADLIVAGRPVQCKVHSNIDSYLNEENLFNPKYRNMRFVVPSDHYKPLQNELYSRYKRGFYSKPQYISASNRITMGRTSYAELVKYTDSQGYVNPKIAYAEATKAVNIAFLNDCMKMTATTTITSGVIGSVQSSVKNVDKYLKGDISKEDCVKNILKETAKAAGKGFAIGTSANVISFIGLKTSNVFLQTGNVSLTLANGVFDLGATYKEFASGNIDANNFLEQVITKSIISATMLLARAAFITNPVLSTVTALVTSAITNELLKGTSKYVYLGEARLFNQEIANSLVKQREEYIGKCTKLITQQEKTYAEAREYLKQVAIDQDTASFYNDLMLVTDTLKVNVNLDSYDNFKKTVKKKGKISL